MHITAKKIVSAAAATTGALALVLVGSTSSIASAPDVFKVTSLTYDNPVFTDADDLAGDDDGFVGVTGTKYLFGGDSNTIAYDLSDFGNPYTTDIDNSGTSQNNWLFSDFKTQTSYLFVAEETDELLFEISAIQPLDQTGDISGSPIALSETVALNNFDDHCTIFASGYGRVAIWDGCDGVIYDIELPSGVVTTITGAATFADYDATFPLSLDWEETDNDVSQLGVVEFDGTSLHILAVAVDDGDEAVGIYRYDVQDTAVVPAELLSFEGTEPDLWKFTLSPATGQWCSGVEGGWDLITEDEIDELAFCASATFNVVPAVVKPALAATGVDTSGILVAGGVVLLAGAGLLLVARRRVTQQR